MFTGIVSDIGIVDNINSHGDIVIDVKTELANLKTKVGDSISCSGICLSIIKKKKTILSFQSSVETTNRTTIKDWFVGGKINLERSLKFGGEMGGHMITGHIDGIGFFIVYAFILECIIGILLILSLIVVYFRTEKGRYIEKIKFTSKM